MNRLGYFDTLGLVTQEAQLDGFNPTELRKRPFERCGQGSGTRHNHDGKALPAPNLRDPGEGMILQELRELGAGEDSWSWAAVLVRITALIDMAEWREVRVGLKYPACRPFHPDLMASASHWPKLTESYRSGELGHVIYKCQPSWVNRRSEEGKMGSGGRVYT